VKKTSEEKKTIKKGKIKNFFWRKEKSGRKKDFNFCFIFELVAPSIFSPL